MEDETRNALRNANRNPEWWGDFSQLQIKPKSAFKLNQNLDLNLYREIREKIWIQPH